MFQNYYSQILCFDLFQSVVPKREEDREECSKEKKIECSNDTDAKAFLGLTWYLSHKGRRMACHILDIFQRFTVQSATGGSWYL